MLIYLLYYCIYIFYAIYSCDGKAKNVQQPLPQPSVSHDPSEIIHMLIW